MESTYDPVYDNQSPELKQLCWDIAFGLQAVDGIAPSNYMKQLSVEHVRGEKTYYEVDREINRYYNREGKANDANTKEADIVSDAIYNILCDKSFRFDVVTFKGYHKRIFEKLDPEVFHPGEFRTYNITKKEPILGGDTVQYQDFSLLEDSLTYDFSEESSQRYSEMTDVEKVARIAEFTSRIWQVHPFSEGNTRTTAVFIQKYLQSLGFSTNNEVFKKNSLYFRNALVRANYANIPKGVEESRKFLELFFENILLGKNNTLNNDELQV